jgi:hypothetical protein
MLYDNKYLKNIKFWLSFYLIKNMAAAWILCLVSGSMAITDQQLELGVRNLVWREHKDDSIWSIVYVSTVINTATVQHFEVISDRINICLDRACI